MPAGPSAEAMSGETLKRLIFYLAVLEISIFIYTFMPAGPYAEAMSGKMLKELRKFFQNFTILIAIFLTGFADAASAAPFQSLESLI